MVHWWCSRSQLLTAFGNRAQLFGDSQVTALALVTA